MKQKLWILMFVIFLVDQSFLKSAALDPFDDTPVYILFTASPTQIASIALVDQEAYKGLMGELEAFQYRFYDKLLSEEEAPMILKKLQTKSQLILANKDSQEKFLAHLKNVVGYHRIKFVE